MKANKKWCQRLLLGVALMGVATVVQADVIFNDNFNRSPGDTVGNGWIEDEGISSAVALYNLGPPRDVVLQVFGAQDEPPDAAATRLVSTSGYEDIFVKFAYRGSYYSGVVRSDYLYIDYTPDGGNSWILLMSYRLEDANWHMTSLSVLGLKDNAGFGIRLRTTINRTSPYNWDIRGAQIDALSIEGSHLGSPTDTTPPAVSSVSAADVAFPSDVTVSAIATDTQSNIKSAEYSRDGAPWTPMSATDGAFDEMSEDLTATISGLFVNTYEVCVRATDVEDNTTDGTDCDMFDVTAAQLSIAFAGQELDLDGPPTQLKAEVTGPCSSGAEVEFFADLGSGYVSQGSADTDTSGVATMNASLPAGVYDIKVEVGDQDLGGDSEPECDGDMDTGITVVADPNASSTGGGWYKIDGLTPPRANFGYTAQRKYNKKLDEYFTSGNLLWMHQDSWRLKGAIDSGGMLPEEMCDSEFAACAAFAGEGTIYEHNTQYDPACLPTEYCGLEWVNPTPNTPFVLFVNDGGTSRECVGKKRNCKDVEKPDQFGIQIELETLDAESDPLYLSGGNLIVR